MPHARGTPSLCVLSLWDCCWPRRPLRPQLSDADIETLRTQGLDEEWTFTVGHNPATQYDLSELCGLRPPENWGTEAPVKEFQPTRDVPVAFDWREVTGCPPIRNQAACGSCWAFGTAGAFECAIMIRDSAVVDLSEQWLVSCNQDGWGCDGGWWAHSYHSGLRDDPCGGNGAVMEADFPYAAADLPCSCPYPHQYWLDGWGYIVQGEVAQPWQIKQTILDHGPVAVAVAVDSAFQAYTGGVFNACGATSINHAIVLVGWDDTQGGFGGVWILRNSWGPGWGEDGYMRIPYGCNLVGYGSTWVDYAGRGLSATPYGSWDAEGPSGGPFEPDNVTYTVENNAATSISYSVSADVNWLTITNGSGSLASGATVDAIVSINAEATTLPDGNYTATISFENQTSHVGDTTRTLNLTVGVAPLLIDFPAGRPAYLAPGVATPIDVRIMNNSETYEDGTGLLHYRYQGGEFSSVPLTHVSGATYQATLPPASCADGPEYYVSAESSAGSLVTQPGDAPGEVYTAVVAAYQAFFADNFESDLGWVAENLGASSGDWQRGIPVNDPDWQYDPTDDADGSGRCYLTQNEIGNTDVDGGAVRLTSPTIDLAGAFDVQLSYYYFLRLSNEDGSDALVLEVDPNGGTGTWVEIARHDTDGGLNWRSHALTQADLTAAGVPLTETMRFRFTTNDADSQSINESGLDAFYITGMHCVNPTQYSLTVNTTGAGIVTLDPPGGSYFADTVVTLTADADPGWFFDHWEGDLSGSTNPESILVNGDKSVTAVFVEIVDCNGNGVPDDQDLISGVCVDFNENGVPDDCDVAPGGASSDCNANGVPDECEVDARSGLAAAYYDDMEFAGLLRGRLDANIAFNWVANEPWPTLGADTYSVRWTGYVLTPAAAGEYTFFTNTDDGVRLWVDGQLLIDQWVDQGATEWSGAITLAADSPYAIMMEYYENGGSAVAELRWQPPGMAKELIPAANLVPGRDCNANGVPDACDLGSVSLDANANGIPDECECPGDLDGNGLVDLSDLQILLGSYGQMGMSYYDGDLDGDGDVDLTDLQELLGHYGTSCA